MGNLTKPFYRISLKILNYIPVRRWFPGSVRLEQELKSLSPGNKGETVYEYYAKKMAAALTILFWGVGVSVVAALALNSGEQQAGNTVIRPEYGQGALETEVAVRIEGESEEARLQLQVEERKYTKTELDEKFTQAMMELDKLVAGENQTLDEVKKTLYLPAVLDEGRIAVEWYPEPADLINDKGELLRRPESKGELIRLRAVLKCQDQEAEYVVHARIFPPDSTEEERIRNKIQDQIDRTAREAAYEDKIVLPLTVEGKKLEWVKAGETTSVVLLGLAVVLSVGSLVSGKSQREKRLRLRKRQLILDYPELLLKLTMLLSAGLTMKAAVEKIAMEYRDREKKEIRYAYEELLAACFEIQNGMPEAKAYESFGNRCQEARYIKLGNLLAQNLKKGSRGLIELLEGEMAAGMEERKNEARKLGEEAGTKLLVPMMLMLLVVLVILMVPAVLSF